jgi:hypothetical protein
VGSVVADSAVVVADSVVADSEVAAGFAANACNVRIAKGDEM